MNSTVQIEPAISDSHAVFLLLPLILIISIALFFVQIFLSKNNNKFYGFILPVISFIGAIIIMFIYHSQYISAYLGIFVLANFPTAIHLIIYAICREKVKRKLQENSQINKMNIQDLE